MTLTQYDVVIAVILFTCVPLQYFLVQNFGNSESNRSYALHKFINFAKKLGDDYFTWRSWKLWLVRLLDIEDLFPELAEPDEADVGESPAIEVMRLSHKHGYFSFSPDPRTSRPPGMLFRIGQVVQHKRLNYRGVIVGWDEIAKAPKEWLDEMHGNINKEWREMPNYSILVDTRDRLSPQLTYVPEVNIEVIENTQIIHPLTDDHFEGYDGAQYIARPWLKAMYPHD